MVGGLLIAWLVTIVFPLPPLRYRGRLHPIRAAWLALVLLRDLAGNLTRQGRAVEGEVMLRVLVSVDGSPLKITIDRSSRHRELDQAAMQAVKRWKFNPEVKNGRLSWAAFVANRARLEREGRFDVATAIRVARAVLSALAAAHDHVVQPALDEQVAVAVDRRAVPGREPALGVERTRVGCADADAVEIARTAAAAKGNGYNRIFTISEVHADG